MPQSKNKNTSYIPHVDPIRVEDMLKVINEVLSMDNYPEVNISHPEFNDEFCQDMADNWYEKGFNTRPDLLDRVVKNELLDTFKPMKLLRGSDYWVQFKNMNGNTELSPEHEEFEPWDGTEFLIPYVDSTHGIDEGQILRMATSLHGIIQMMHQSNNLILGRGSNDSEYAEEIMNMEIVPEVGKMLAMLCLQAPQLHNLINIRPIK